MTGIEENYMYCKVLSACLQGISAIPISVEVDVAGGLPSFNMVGLPSSEIREARDRVERAIVNSGIDFPARRITVNLSPAGIKKQGSGFDLPIAVGILTACGIIKEEALKDRMFIGELGLDGKICRVRGVLPVSILAKQLKQKCVVVPAACAFEGSAVDGITVHSASDLGTLIHELNTGENKDITHIDLDELLENAYENSLLDYKDVNGQEKAKRATMIAVAGFHNLLYVGPPGAGKSMMAQRIPTIFGKMTKDECLEVSAIYSVAGLLKEDSLILERPFRNPHQTITRAALMGGSAPPHPGEITLAHRGVLFLDELSEFSRSVVEDLRVPLEKKEVSVDRASGKAVFPCDMMFVAATNPCRCGFYPDRKFCHCTDADVQKYLEKIKGPVLDRIDICVGITRVEIKDLYRKKSSTSSAEMREKVQRAQEIQKERFRNMKARFNSDMSSKEIEKLCTAEKSSMDLLKNAYEKLNMTVRGYHKILKVARTIADVEGSDVIQDSHMLEAIGYRNSFISR